MSKLLIILSFLFLASCMPGDYSSIEKSEVIVEENEDYNPTDRTPSGQDDDGSIARVGLIMADRKYLDSVLENVYGPSYDSRAFVRDNIMRKQDVFGAPCDMYEREFVGDTSAVLDSATNCYADTWNTDTNLTSTTLRQGWLIRACEELSGNTGMGRFALDKAGIDLQEDNYSYQKTNSLYNLFAPQKDLDPSVHKVIVDHKGSLSNEEFWRTTLTAFCISPDWQYF